MPGLRNTCAVALAFIYLITSTAHAQDFKFHLPLEVPCDLVWRQYDDVSDIFDNPTAVSTLDNEIEGVKHITNLIVRAKLNGKFWLGHINPNTFLGIFQTDKNRFEQTANFEILTNPHRCKLVWTSDNVVFAESSKVAVALNSGKNAPKVGRALTQGHQQICPFPNKLRKSTVKCTDYLESTGSSIQFKILEFDRTIVAQNTSTKLEQVAQIRNTGMAEMRHKIITSAITSFTNRTNSKTQAIGDIYFDIFIEICGRDDGCKLIEIPIPLFPIPPIALIIIFRLFLEIYINLGLHLQIKMGGGKVVSFRRERELFVGPEMSVDVCSKILTRNVTFALSGVAELSIPGVKWEKVKRFVQTSIEQDQSDNLIKEVIENDVGKGVKVAFELPNVSEVTQDGYELYLLPRTGLDPCS